MDVISIKRFWNNGFDKGCDKDNLLFIAKCDINQLIEVIEKLEKENKEQKDNLETLESAYWDR